MGSMHKAEWQHAVKAKDGKNLCVLGGHRSIPCIEQWVRLKSEDWVQENSLVGMGRKCCPETQKFKELKEAGVDIWSVAATGKVEKSADEAEKAGDKGWRILGTLFQEPWYLKS